MTAYDSPLDLERLSAEQGEQRAKLCDRLETMWQGLQEDIVTQRETSERGVDPRSQQLQLQVLKLQAQLWRLLAAPMPQAPPRPDPEEARVQAQAEAEAQLARVQAALAERD